MRSSRRGSLILRYINAIIRLYYAIITRIGYARVPKGVLNGYFNGYSNGYSQVQDDEDGARDLAGVDVDAVSPLKYL